MTQDKQTGQYTVRGVNPELWLQARAESIKQGKTIGQWLSEAIELKLTKNGKHKKS